MDSGGDAAAQRVFTLHGKDVVAGWPPQPRVWLEFHHYVRTNVSSHSRYVSVLNNVANYGRNQFSLQVMKKGMSVHPAMADPTVLYRVADRKMRLLLKREYGERVKKSKYIDMEEARNGHKFVDVNSGIGLQDAGVWNISCDSGGRRSRSISSIQLKHLTEIVVEEVCDGCGGLVKVPSFGLEFADEKYMDPRGYRRWRESFLGWQDIWGHGWLSASFYIYSLLVYRGAFVEGNPLLTAKPGDILQLHEHCKEWYLFCDWEGDVPLDCVPWSTSNISNSTRKLEWASLSEATELTVRVQSTGPWQ